MLLKSIRLQNFRQYRGNQKINFSCDKERNVTVILGDNTSGKTTLVQAFNWALYGTNTFKSKELLNQDLALEMTEGDEEIVEVEICLNHDETEYIISRTQKYQCTARGVISRPSLIKVCYKQSDGQIIPIRMIEIENTIKKILPEDLSDYFFFDGERISSISNKKDVTEAVKGLLGLSVLDNTIKHLNPNRKTSVVGRFKDSMDIEGNMEAKIALKNIEDKQSKREKISQQLYNVRNEINHYVMRRDELEEILRKTRPTAELQRKKEELEKYINHEKTALKKTYDMLINDFNTNATNFFAQPLMSKALELLKKEQMVDKGIPNMNATSIDHIIKRGYCICGTKIFEGNAAYEHLKKEREYLPPQAIGTLIRNFREAIKMYNSTNNSYYNNICSKYKDILRYKERLQEWMDEVEYISEKIQGKEDVGKYEEELRDVKNRLRNFSRRKDELIREDESCKKEIENNQRKYDNLATVSDKNKQISLYIKYAEAIYEWVKDTYESKEIEIREQLEVKVNEIFGKMYHGQRKVVIDDKYRVKLLTSVADKQIETDESQGLETVKNFAFIAGLVDLARQKISSKAGAEEMPLSSEPYPLVMDAPFSNTDEKHISRISKILPEIAEQVIMVVMASDWGFAEPVMGQKVGKMYTLDKKSETLTYVKECN